jgi:FAD:protein FMN transferase
VTDAYVRTVAAMGTVVTIHIVGQGNKSQQATDRALAWFAEVERVCSRFDPASELSLLSARIGEPVPLSDLLFEAIRFALAVAAETEGAFDPTVGLQLEERGFDREYRSGRVVRSPHRTYHGAGGASYRDLHLDVDHRTLMLARPLLLDLGAVAKGLAVDLAARELATSGIEHFVVDAGGDLYLAGRNANDEPWSVGIRHPRDEQSLIETLCVSDVSVCTSGDYERRAGSSGAGGQHHIVDPRTSESPRSVASVTVLAPSAMAADALGTAAFVLGPAAGIELLERHGVDGMIITSDLARCSTERFAGFSAAGVPGKSSARAAFYGLGA